MEKRSRARQWLVPVVFAVGLATLATVLVWNASRVSRERALHEAKLELENEGSLERRVLPAYYDPDHPNCPPVCPDLREVEKQRREVTRQMAAPPGVLDESQAKERDAKYELYLKTFHAGCEAAELKIGSAACRPFAREEWERRADDPLSGLDSL
jgi:hypothetical protein